MYLPQEIPDAHVLITVKTYPLPSSKYEELVCTAGLLDDGKWIRVYPVPFRALAYKDQYKKYEWVTLNLVRNTSDFRPESYRPKQGSDENIRITGDLDTRNDWAQRKSYVLGEVFTSMNELIQLAKGLENRSLATLKPVRIIDFIIEPDERDWKPEWLAQLQQLSLFELDEKGQGQRRRVVAKLPYKYSYKFLTEGDSNPRTLMIEDWELGALFWNCLRQSRGDEIQANKLVKQKYLHEFVEQKDVYLFLGTTKQYHNIAPNPFVIIGVFYPPKREAEQLSMF